MRYTHIDMADSQEEVKAMDALTKDVEGVPVNGMKAFTYSRFYIGWETNKVSGCSGGHLLE